MRKIFATAAVAVMACVFAACGGNREMTSPAAETADTALVGEPQENIDNQEEKEQEVEVSSEPEHIEEESTEMKMQVQIGENIFMASLETNDAVDALAEMMKEAPVTIQMSDYSGFEKVGSLGKSLPSNNSQTTTQAGDIVLFNSNQIVIFYGSNSWSYTRLGKIDDLSGWEEALGKGDITVTFSLAQE